MNATAVFHAFLPLLEKKACSKTCFSTAREKQQGASDVLAPRQAVTLKKHSAMLQSCVARAAALPESDRARDLARERCNRSDICSLHAARAGINVARFRRGAGIYVANRNFYISTPRRNQRSERSILRRNQSSDRSTTRGRQSSDLSILRRDRSSDLPTPRVGQSSDLFDPA